MGPSVNEAVITDGGLYHYIENREKRKECFPSDEAFMEFARKAFGIREDKLIPAANRGLARWFRAYSTRKWLEESARMYSAVLSVPSKRISGQIQQRFRFSTTKQEREADAIRARILSGQEERFWEAC